MKKQPEHIRRTRGILPFEPNQRLGFTRLSQDIDSMELEYQKSAAKVFFDEAIADLFENVDASGHGNVLAYKIDTDDSSEIVVIVMRKLKKIGQSCSLDGKKKTFNKIILQDRLFGQIRDQYDYQQSSASEFEIARKRQGDIAVQNHLRLLEEYPDKNASEAYSRLKEEPVTLSEIVDIFYLIGSAKRIKVRKVLGKPLNYPDSDRRRPWEPIPKK